MTKPMKSGGVVWAGAVALGLVLVGCGSNQVDGSAVTGVALSSGPVAGTVVLSDSSAQPQQRQVSTRADGSFSVDVAGLTPPYMLRVAYDEAGGSKRLYAVSGGNENLDVNALTDVAFSVASGDRSAEETFERSGAEEKRTAVTRARTLLTALQAVLAPLFERYGITDPVTDKAAVRALLEDVTVQRDDGVVTVVNKETGAVIFTGPLADLASGTFNPDAMPAGPGTTPPPSACTYTYGDWSACTSGTQTRSVLSASPSGCVGTPVVTQACTGTPPPPSACTYTYGAWGTCSSSGTQSRTVLSSSPAGCTGTPVLTQACTYVPPPPAACTYTYSAWGTCSSSGTQTRTVVSSSPSGCAGTPVLSQACTSTPPIDGAALYTQYCSGCHGNSKKGSSASAIQGAIDSNRGGMGSLKFLTAAQVQAISAAP